MQLTFTGGKELAAALRKLPAAVATEILETAVVSGAGIIREAAATNAPRPALRRRGGVRLADSIKVTVTEQTRSAVTVNVGTKARYAHLVEYGHQVVPRGPTRKRVSVTRVSRSGRTITRLQAVPNRERRGAIGFVPPRPFLRPAFDENREAVLRRIGQVLEKGIKTEARKLAPQVA